MQQFTIMRALGLSFRVWFRNFVPFTILTALLYAPVFAYVATIDFESASNIDELLDRVFVWPVYLVTAAATLLSPMLTYKVVSDINGEKVSMLTSVKLGVRGIVPAAILAIVTNVVQFLPGGGIISTVLLCYYFVAAPAAVAEKLGPFAAFSRSAELTKGRRWGIFGLTFLIGIIVFLALIAWILPMANDPLDEILSGLRTTALLMVAGVGLLHMFNGIVEAVTYALLREDKDGVSTEQLARIFA